MRYIRTENGVYEFVKAIGSTEIIVKDEEYGGVQALYYDAEQLKKSNKIENLCDKFVEVHKVLQNGIFDRPYFDIVRKEVADGGPVGDLYGAIWTSKGLIYVAKMNKKGELELI